MKTILLLMLSAMLSFALPPPVAPKRPLGVPADAKPFNGRWYKVYLEKKSWHAARDKCKELGGQLVTVPDAATWEFVKTLTTGAKLWLGATDEEVAGVWKWSDGSVVTFKAWGAGQPDNAGNAEHYVAMFGHVWADVPKTPVIGNVTISGFICEWVSR